MINLGLGGRFGRGFIGANIPIATDTSRSKRASQLPVGQTKSAEDPNIAKPLNDINRMMAQVKQSGFYARPCLYYIIITPPAGLFTDVSPNLASIGLNCNTVSIPGINVSTKPKDGGWSFQEYAYHKIWEPITMSFYLSENMQEHILFKKWLDVLYDGDHIGYYSDYIGTIEVFQSSKNMVRDSEDLEVIMSATLVDAYPKTLSALELGHDKKDAFHTLSTTVMYRDVVYKHYAEGNVSGSSKIDSLVNRGKKILTEAGTLVQDTLNELKPSLPKLASLIKNKQSFLPVNNPSLSSRNFGF